MSYHESAYRVLVVQLYFINAWKPVVQSLRSLSLKGSNTSVVYFFGLDTSLDDPSEGPFEFSIRERNLLCHDPSSMSF